jgi:hypothetical protein
MSPRRHRTRQLVYERDRVGLTKTLDSSQYEEMMRLAHTRRSLFYDFHIEPSSSPNTRWPMEEQEVRTDCVILYLEYHVVTTLTIKAAASYIVFSQTRQLLIYQSCVLTHYCIVHT